MSWQAAHPWGETEAQENRLSRSQLVGAEIPEPNTGRRKQGVREIIRAEDPHLPYPQRPLGQERRTPEGQESKLSLC